MKGVCGGDLGDKKKILDPDVREMTDVEFRGRLEAQLALPGATVAGFATLGRVARPVVVLLEIASRIVRFSLATRRGRYPDVIVPVFSPDLSFGPVRP